MPKNKNAKIAEYVVWIACVMLVFGPVHDLSLISWGYMLLTVACVILYLYLFEKFILKR